MSWDTRMVALHIRVSVHDDADVNQEQLCDQVSIGATRWVREYLDSFGPLGDSVEIELL